MFISSLHWIYDTCYQDWIWERAIPNYVKMGWNDNNSKQSQFTTDCQRPQTDFTVFDLGKATESVLYTSIERALPQLVDQYAYTKQQSTIDALVKFATVITHNQGDKSNIAV